MASLTPKHLDAIGKKLWQAQKLLDGTRKLSDRERARIADALTQAEKFINKATDILEEGGAR